MSAPRQYLSPDDRRLMLLDAARELVETDGLDALSIPAVATKAGASRALVYSFFPGNDALLAAFFAQCIQRYQHVLDLVDAEVTDAHARAIRLLRSLSELPITDLYSLNAVVHSNGSNALMTARQDLEALTKARWSALYDFDSAPPALFTVLWLFAGITLTLAIDVNAGNTSLDGAEALLRELLNGGRGFLTTIL